MDALSTLLLAIMFLLSVFVIAQFLLSRDLSGRDTVLDRLNSQIAELNQLLALERSNSTDFQDQIAALQASLAGAETERTRLQAALDGERSAAAPGAGARRSASCRPRWRRNVRSRPRRARRSTS